MAKTIKEVFELYEQHIRNHSRLSKRPELSLDQALKELEAIISAAKPQIANTDPFTNALKPALNQAIDQYEANLKEALYETHR